jgi:hypothetical protein
MMENERVTGSTENKTKQGRMGTNENKKSRTEPN